MQEVLTKLDGFRELVEEKFETGEKEHKTMNDNIAKQNGRIKKLEAFKYMFMGGMIMTNAILIPLAFMVLNNYL